MFFLVAMHLSSLVPQVLTLECRPSLFDLYMHPLGITFLNYAEDIHILFSTYPTIFPYTNSANAWSK